MLYPLASKPKSGTFSIIMAEMTLLLGRHRRVGVTNQWVRRACEFGGHSEGWSYDMSAPQLSGPSGAALPSDALVVFGFTGDLAHKKIFPALYAMVKKKMLTVPVIGVASTSLDTGQMHARVRDSLEHEGGIDDAPAFDRLLSLLRYVSGDYRQAETFQRLKAALAGSAAGPLPRHPAGVVRDRDPGPRRRRPRPRRASSSKSRSAATSPRRSSSTPSPMPSSRSRRSSGSTTTSARRRS